MDGGALMNQASHYIDLLYWLLGPVKSVSAFAKTHRDIEMEDTAVLNFDCSSGAIAGMSVTMLTYPQNLESSITILGEKGSVKITGPSANIVETWKFDDQKEYDHFMINNVMSKDKKNTSGHEKYYLNVYDALNENDKPISDGNQGLKSLKILDAAYKSIENGSMEKINLKLMSSFLNSMLMMEQRLGMIKIWHFSHISEKSKIGSGVSIGQNVYIANNVTVGDGCKIQNNVSVYEGVTLEEGVFCGPSMVFTNVYNPRSFVERKDEYRPTLVKKGASLGANCTIVCGVTIGNYAFVGAGALINKNVKDFALMVGVPARQLGWISKIGEKATTSEW